MDVDTVLVASVTFLCAYILLSRRKYYELAWKFPGPLGLPLIGCLYQLYDMSKMLYVLSAYTIKYKAKTVLIWLGPCPTICTTDPKVIEIALTSPNSMQKSILYDALMDLAQDGLITSKPPRWNKHRKLLNPSFKHSVLLGYFSTFNKIADKLCDQFDPNLDNGELDKRKILFDIALETAIATTSGMEPVDENVIQTIGCVFERMVAMSVDKLMNPMLRSKTIYHKTKLYKRFMDYRETIQNFFYDLIIKKTKDLNSNELVKEQLLTKYEPEIGARKSKITFVDHVVEIYGRNQFTLEDIFTETGVILFTAYDTSATALYLTLMCMAMHPQYQDRVFDEIYTTFPDNDFDVKYEDFKNLVYLDMCINETLRLFAPIPMVARTCTADLRLSDDIVLPKGTQIMIDIFNMHRDKDIWGPEAHVYNPDNFLSANLSDKHKYSFIPFSKGPRNCIGWQYAGMVLKVMLVKLLRKYKFSTKFKLEDLKFVERITLRFQEYPHLEVQKREPPVIG